MTMDITPPPAVVEFINKYKNFDNAIYIGDWENFQVFYLDKNGVIKFGGYIDYLLYKDGNVRKPNEEEYSKIYEKFDAHIEDKYDRPLGTDIKFNFKDLTN